MPPKFVPPHIAIVPSLPMQAPVVEEGPTEPLEQRIYDLLSPFLELAPVQGLTRVPHAEQAKAMVLCENLAFLIRHNQGRYGKRIGVGDILVVTNNWHLRAQGGNGVISVAVFIYGMNGFTYNLIRAFMGTGDKVIDKLAECVEPLLRPFCPGL